jgi:hypothetical protein
MNIFIANVHTAVFDALSTYTVEYSGKTTAVLYDDMPMHADVFIRGKKEQLIQTAQAK